MDSALELGVAAGGWFACINPTEEREILDSLLKNSFFPTAHSETRQEESMSSHQSFSTHGSELSPFTSPYSSVGLSPELRTPKEEEIQPSESLTDSRMIIQETLKIPRIILGTLSL